MADPKATPINALPKGPQGNGEEDSQFIQKILNQMNDDNAEADQAYQQTQDNYQQQQFAVNQEQQHQMNQQQMEQAQYENMQNQQYEEQYQYEEVPEPTFSEKVKSAIKQPILFLVLYFILCMPFVRTMMVNQVARFTQNGTIQLYGSSLLIGLVGAVVFYLVNRFVFN